MFILCILAGSFARRVNAKQLVLTHFSPRYSGDYGELSMRTMWRIEDLARSTSGLQGMNDVVAAWDYLVLKVDLEGPKSEELEESTIATTNEVSDADLEGESENESEQDSSVR